MLFIAVRLLIIVVVVAVAVGPVQHDKYKFHDNQLFFSIKFFVLDIILF